MEYDYAMIEARIRHARQLRSEALGELLASGGHHVAAMVTRLFRRVQEAIYSGHLLHH